MMREGQLDFDVTGLVCFCGYQIYPTCTIDDIMTKGVELRTRINFFLWSGIGAFPPKEIIFVQMNNSCVNA